MNVPQDKQTVITLLQELINKKQVIRFEDYGNYAMMVSDRKFIREFKKRAQMMLDKFKDTVYSPDHFQEAVRKIDRIVFREEDGAWRVEYIPGQFEPVEIHRAIYRLLVYYFNDLLGVPRAELTSITYNCKCPYCAWPNKLTEKADWFDCRACGIMVLFPEV
jgi:hypothetical protein